MKKPAALFALLLSLACNASAQHFSVGFRSGASAWGQRAATDNSKLEAAPGGRFSWDQNLFFRREGKKRWSFEIGLSHSARSGTRTQLDLVEYPYFAAYDLTTKQRADSYELPVSVQYDITCGHLKASPLMRRFHSYAGLTVTPVFSRIRETYAFNSPVAEPIPPSLNQKFDVWTGLSHTLLFDAAPHIAVSAVLEGSMAPAQLFSGGVLGNEYRPATRAGVRLGAAYRF